MSLPAPLQAYLGHCAQVLFETEEEIGSPGLASILEQHRDLLRADYAVSSDGLAISEDQNGIIMGLRGGIAVEVTVTTLSTDVHSGACWLLAVRDAKCPGCPRCSPAHAGCPVMVYPALAHLSAKPAPSCSVTRPHLCLSVKLVSMSQAPVACRPRWRQCAERQRSHVSLHLLPAHFQRCDQYQWLVQVGLLACRGSQLSAYTCVGAESSEPAAAMCWRQTLTMSTTWLCSPTSRLRR